MYQFVLGLLLLHLKIGKMKFEWSKQTSKSLSHKIEGSQIVFLLNQAVSGNVDLKMLNPSKLVRRSREYSQAQLGIWSGAVGNKIQVSGLSVKYANR